MSFLRNCSSVVVVLAIILLFAPLTLAAQEPLRIGVAGLTHDHVHGILGREDKGDIEIVGIAESDHELAERYSEMYGFPMDLVYPTLDEMLETAKPEAVAAFNSIAGHLEVVEKCAPRGIHVIVEKPLAVSLADARRMEQLAKENNIELLTNYETTWYGSSHEAYKIAVGEGRIGDIRKIVVHDGHEGPAEIGCSPEFLNWLCDPELNGAGALFDFGCYGANLATWLMQGSRPEAVFAVTQQIKPDKYPDVDDEATIVLTYPEAQAIIQASWNWPFSRKDMELYGARGYVIAMDGTAMEVRLPGQEDASEKKAPPREYPYNDPFALFSAVLRGDIALAPYALSSLENNMIVMEILDAARTSAASGEIVRLR